jgi:hypothetical protein
MEKCTVCMEIVVEKNKIHAYTKDGEGCCKTCWDWLKDNFPISIEEKKE